MTASATTWMRAWVHLTLAACATVLERFTNADVRTFQKATATATATNSTRLARVVVLARRTLMRTAFATT